MNPLHTFAAGVFAALSLSVHAVGQLADISLLDRTTGRQLPVHWHEGRAYVVGNPGSEYRIVMRNRIGDDLLGVVSVDGVNVLSGETANAQQTGYVVSRREKLDIGGWRKSMDETAAFYFTSLGDSYAARTDRPKNVGVIGVALFKRAPPPVYLPPLSMQAAPGELAGKRESQDSRATAPARAESFNEPRLYAEPSAPLGTGHGRREPSNIRFVSFERATAEPVETIAIHYDSYANLVSRGVLAAARWPQPFPGFVPDPPPAALY